MAYAELPLVRLPGVTANTFRCSSAVERSTVNRMAGGSNPPVGAWTKVVIRIRAFVIVKRSYGP